MVPAFDPRLTIVEPNRGGGMIAKAILSYREHEPAREKGLHCSTIVNDVVSTLYPKKHRRPFEEKATLAYQEIGNVIEDVVARELRFRLFKWSKPEPILHRGVWCSPDGWSAKSRTIDEVKATWVSEREFLDSPKLHGYLMQAMMYACAFKAVRIRLHVLFINGTYRPPVPNPRTFVVRWTKAAPDAYCLMLRMHARDRGLLKGRFTRHE